MKYGSQDAGDATAEREKAIERGADRRVERLNRLDEILNRPLGSIVSKSKEQQIEDLEYRLNKPDEAVLQLQQRAQSRGPDYAVWEFLKEAKRLGYVRDEDGTA